LFFSFYSISALKAQMIEDPTVWSFEAKQIKGDEYEIQFQVKVKNDYHIYSLDPGGDGSFLPPSFEIEANPIYEPNGEMSERGKKISETIEDIGTVYYYKEVVFVQPARISGTGVLKGQYTYMVCNDVGCLPPKTRDFSIPIGVSGSGSGGDIAPQTGPE